MLGSGDCRDATLVAKEADSPTWSKDGRWLAYRRGEDLQLLDTKTGKTSTLASGPEIRVSGPSGWQTDSLQMSFDPIRPMLVAAVGDGLRVYSLKAGAREESVDILTHPTRQAFHWCRHLYKKVCHRFSFFHKWHLSEVLSDV